MTISLEKRKEKVGIILAKRNVTRAPTVRVGLSLDVSGSAQPLYTGGVMQDVTDRLLGIASTFDDNGEMDMWCFSNGFNRLETATSSDYGTYIRNRLLRSGASLWGGTQYAPALRDITGFYFPQSGAAPSPPKPSGGLLSSLFGKKPAAVAPPPPPAASSSLPAMCLFITDGANSDRTEAARVLRDAQKYPVYWSMIGVGNPREFGFLKEMADELPNVGFVNLSSLSIGDDELYEQLITDEFCTWVRGIA